jgi:hypothetical protein
MISAGPFDKPIARFIKVTSIFTRICVILKKEHNDRMIKRYMEGFS